jgi:hypothetical protein
MSSYKINNKNILALTQNQSNQYQLTLGGNSVTDCSSILIGGSVGIGTTDTTYKLNINGDVNINGNLIIKSTIPLVSFSMINNILINKNTYNKQTFLLPLNKVVSPSNIIATIDTTNALSGLSRDMKLTYGLRISRKWVAVGNGTNQIAYSTDGITWSFLGLSVFGAAGSGKGIAWNGSMWVVVGSGTNQIAYSPDGLSWIIGPTTVFGTAGSGKGIAWNGSMWVVVGSGTNQIAYSTDGTIWTPGPTTVFGAAGSGNGIAWNGSMWVVVGSGTNQIAYSTDGTIWTPSPTTVFSAAGSGNGIGWNGSIWVAVGNGTNTIAYSSN